MGACVCVRVSEHVNEEERRAQRHGLIKSKAFDGKAEHKRRQGMARGHELSWFVKRGVRGDYLLQWGLFNTPSLSPIQTGPTCMFSECVFFKSLAIFGSTLRESMRCLRFTRD